MDIHVITVPNLRLDRDPHRARLLETARRMRDRLVLLTEHRAAPASPPVQLELVSTDPATTHLEVVAEVREESRDDLGSRVLALLAGGEAWTRAKLRETLSVQNERLGRVLQSLEQAGRIHRTACGWQVVK